MFQVILTEYQSLFFI